MSKREKSLQKNYRKKNKQWKRASGMHCSRCCVPTGRPGICDRCRSYVSDWKKSNTQLVYAAKKRRHSDRRDRKGILLKKLLQKQKGRCVLCGDKADKWHLDHVIPVVRGGCSEDFNMQALCVMCNLRKGSKIIDPNRNDVQLRLLA